MKNLNPKTNPITTILGALMLLVAVVMFIAPMFIVIKEQLNYWIPGTIGIIGLCLLLIPDDLKGALRKLLNRKADQI